MKKVVLCAIAILLFSVAEVRAQSIIYTSSTNTWDYSGFLKTNVGSYTNTGLGVLADDGGIIVGGGSHFLWNSNLTGGGAGTYDFGTYTDYYWPDGFEIDVVGPSWTNTEVRLNNQGEGIFGYQHLDSTTLSTPISDGTILNGTFTLDTSGASASWSYAANIPEPSSLSLICVATIGLCLKRRRRRRI